MGMEHSESLHSAGPVICPHTKAACVAEHSPAECDRFWDCLQERMQAEGSAAPDRSVTVDTIRPAETDVA